MSTLVLRLAGPLQSWGDHARYTHRPTLPHPTYAGVLGLFRAALGVGRDADPADWAWLRDLSILVRADRPGRITVDYQTINPPPDGHWDTPLKTKKQNAHQITTGSGTAWGLGGTPSTLPTRREYITDAHYTVLVEGPREQIDRLAGALASPHWQISLGRKACLPDWPFLLGVSDEPARDLATAIPLPRPPHGAFRRHASAAPEAAQYVELHDLTPAASPGAAGNPVSQAVHADDPVAGHPHLGHRPRTRTITTIRVAPAPADQAAWALDNLRQENAR